MQSRSVTIEFVCPPIGTRIFDYRATFDDDEPCDGQNKWIGWGRTPLLALSDLLEDAEYE